MMRQADRTAYSKDIQREYEKINHQWMLLHYRTVIAIIIIGITTELFLSFSFYGMEDSIAISFEDYAAKFILRPVLLNLGWLGVAIAARRIPDISSRVRIYLGSLALIGACFVFYSAHYIFYISMIFYAPVLLTAFYGDYRLTTAVMGASVLTKLLSDFFIFWDATRELPFESGYSLMRIVVSTMILGAFYAVSMVMIAYQKKKNDAVIRIELDREAMHQRMITDPLTGIYNRIALRSMFQLIETSESGSFHLAMLDLDNFKQINDTFGHAGGDECLEAVGAILKRHGGDDVTSFRFGGDEFCILFKNKEHEEVEAVCDSIREEVRRLSFDFPAPELSVSVGIARYQRGRFAEDMLSDADKALYRAKSRSRVLQFN